MQRPQPPGRTLPAAGGGRVGVGLTWFAGGRRFGRHGTWQSASCWQPQAELPKQAPHPRKYGLGRGCHHLILGQPTHGCGGTRLQGQQRGQCSIGLGLARWRWELSVSGHLQSHPEGADCLRACRPHLLARDVRIAVQAKDGGRGGQGVGRNHAQELKELGGGECGW